MSECKIISVASRKGGVGKSSLVNALSIGMARKKCRVLAIGIMAAAIYCHVGAKHVIITNVNDYRLNLAKEIGEENGKGIIQTVNVTTQSIEDTMKELGIEQGFEVMNIGKSSKVVLDWTSAQQDK